MPIIGVAVVSIESDGIVVAFSDAQHGCRWDRARMAAQLAKRTETETARRVGIAALGGPGHAAARAAATAAARRGLERRTKTAAADTARFDVQVRAARGI